MGKKQKEKRDGAAVNVSGGGGNAKPINLNAVPNRDIMQRMNFLWQASVYLEGLHEKKSGGYKGNLKDDEVEVGGGKGERMGRRRRVVDGCDLARIYVRTMKIVGQKTTVKMDPGVKRTLCRGCSIVLVPGVSAHVRTRSSREHQHLMVYTCIECGTSRKIPAPRSGLTEDLVLSVNDSTEINNPPRLIQTPSIVQQQHKEEEEHREENETGVHGGDKEHTTSAQLSIPHEEREEGEVRNTQEMKNVKVKKKKKKSVERRKRIPREPPLFARRNAGHVVYRGGEVVDMEGVYCA